MSQLPVTQGNQTQLEEAHIHIINQIETLPVTAKEIAAETAIDFRLKPFLESLREGNKIENEIRFVIDQNEFLLVGGNRSGYEKNT